MSSTRAEMRVTCGTYLRPHNVGSEIQQLVGELRRRDGKRFVESVLDVVFEFNHGTKHAGGVLHGARLDIVPVHDAIAIVHVCLVTQR